MFPFTQTDKVISIFIDGRPSHFATDHPSFESIREAIEADDEAGIRALVDIRQNVKDRTMGRVQILDSTILVGGREVTGRLVNRILEMVSRGNKAVDGYIKFLDNLMDNPAKRAVDELYTFIEECDLPITSEGNFLAYKRVRSDYTDCHSGTFDNSVGQAPEMPRNMVDEDKNRTCSAGLHFCSYSYLSQFYGDKVMVVEINPADVVAIPADYNNAKGRTCKYTVVGEIDDWETHQITPYFTDEYDEDEDEVEDDDADFDDEEVDEVVAPVKRSGRGQKLSEDQVRVIKNDFLPDYHNDIITLTAIGEIFDVHRETIARIDRGDIWADVS